MDINFLPYFKQGDYNMQLAVKPNNKKIAFEVKSVVAQSKVYQKDKKFYLDVELNTTNPEHANLLSQMQNIKESITKYLFETKLANKKYTLENIKQFYKNDGLFVNENECSDENAKINEKQTENDNNNDDNDGDEIEIDDIDEEEDENDEENDESDAEEDEQPNKQQQICKQHQSNTHKQDQQGHKNDNDDCNDIFLNDDTNASKKNNIKVISVEIHPDCQILKTNNMRTFLDAPENINESNILDIIIVFTGLKYNSTSFSAKYHLYKIKKYFQWEYGANDIVFDKNNDEYDETKYIEKYKKTFYKLNKK